MSGSVFSPQASFGVAAVSVSPAVSSVSNRSETRFSTALLQLMKLKSYTNITVSALAHRAGLSRRTFYRHYATLDEVLDHTLTDLADEFLTFSLARPHTTFGAYALSMFTFWHQHVDLLKLLDRNTLLARELECFMAHLESRLIGTQGSSMKSAPSDSMDATCTVHTNVQPMEHSLRQESQNTATTNVERYVASFTMGALTGLLAQWVADDCWQSPEAMAHLVTLSVRHMVGEH